MTAVRHLNCGTLQAPGFPPAACRRLLLDDPAGLALVDAVGFWFDPAAAAARQVAGLGRRPEDVRDVLLTHADPDHAGGLEFPTAGPEPRSV